MHSRVSFCRANGFIRVSCDVQDLHVEGAPLAGRVSTLGTLL